MSLFKNRNKMEDRLKKQLSGLEFKPSDSLWDKISEGLHDDFEKSVASKVEDFQLNPSDDVWDKIAASVPEPQRNRSRFGLLALLITLIGLSVSATFFLMMSSPSNHLTTLSQKTAHQSSKPFIHDDVMPTVSGTNSTPALTPSEKAEHNNEMIKIIHSNRDLQIKSEQNTSHVFEKRLTPSVRPSNPKQSPRNRKSNKRPIKTNVAKESTILVMNDQITTEDNSSNKLVVENELSYPSVKSDAIVHPDVLDNSKSVNTKPAMNDSLTAGITSIASSNQKDVDVESPTRFTLIADVGMNYCYNRLQAPNSSNRNLNANLALRQSLEIPSIDWSGAFRLSYDINKRWRITTGISMLNFSQEFSYNTTTPMLASSGSDRNAIYINPGDSIINGQGNSTRIKYSWTEIPITIAYKITTGHKWNIEAEAGISYAILSTADAGMINYDNIGILLIRDKSAFPGLVNSWFFTFSPAITYQLNPSITLAVHPSFKTSLNSMIADNSWLKQYPIMTGLSFSIRKRL